MKNLSIILASLTAATGPMIVPLNEEREVRSVRVEERKSGKDSVKAVREAYQLGGYGVVLGELDTAYKNLEGSSLDQLAMMRESEGFGQGKLEDAVSLLEQKRNDALRDLAQSGEQTEFSEIVLSAVQESSDEAEKQAIDRIARLRTMIPGEGKNEDENRLIDIDLEYEFKALHLDIPGTSPAQGREKQCALRMEKLDKMVAASLEFQDMDLKNAVELYAKNFDARLAKSWDTADLMDLAFGRESPKDPLQEEVASILVDYQEQFEDLIQPFLAEHDAENRATDPD